jgi:hypothetical protein
LVSQNVNQNNQNNNNNVFLRHSLPAQQQQLRSNIIHVNPHIQVAQQQNSSKNLQNLQHNINFQKNKSSEIIKTHKGQVPLDRLQNQDLLDKS